MSEMLKIENIRKVFNPGTINEKWLWTVST